MMSHQISLRSGIKIPAIGYGPGMLRIKYMTSKNIIGKIWCRINNRFSEKAKRKRYIEDISNALRVGFRLLDYSIAYGNLKLVGEAIEKSGIKKEDLFLTCRVGNSNQLQDNVRHSVLENLRVWGIEKVDLLQFHWPVTGKYLDTWKEMVRLKEEGYVRVLGVANCHQHHLEALERSSGVLPEINQIEVHPLFTQKPLIKYCKERRILIESYTPIARFDDRVVRLPYLKELERKYNKNLVQIILRWHIQNGLIPIIRTHNLHHLRTNIDVFDFMLTQEEMDKIDAINIDSRLRYNPDNCDFSIL